MIRRCLCALPLALLPVAAHAVCSPGALRASQWTADYVYLMPDSTLYNATSTAASAWGGCVTTPNHPGFPYPTLTPVSGAPYAVLHTAYHAGYNPIKDTACGAFPGQEGGQYVDVFELAKDPQGHTVTCASFGYDQIIEHELGHYFGLADIFDANCSDIMAQLDGSTHYVGMNDCDQANQLNHPLDRDNPVDYSCNQTCYTNCYGGRCPALNGGSPIVIDLDGDGFKLSGPGDPVYFDLYNNGSPVWTAWTARWSDTAFLALDLDGNGNIDNAGELFGNHTRLLADGSFAKSGYEALAQYDELINGGNGNGVIDPGDAVFDRLRIWIDWNHNGKTDPGELQTLAEAGIVAIDLRYWPSHKVDRYGNQFFLRGRAVRKTGDHAHYLTTYDVFFVPAHRQ